MDDKQLSALKQIAPPPPSEAAKNRALSMAREAFEQTETQASEAAIKKNQKNSQGFLHRVRLIHSTQQRLWSFIMKKQLIAGTALAGVLAIVLTTTFVQEQEYTSFNHVANQLAKGASQGGADGTDYEMAMEPRQDQVMGSAKRQERKVVEKARLITGAVPPQAARPAPPPVPSPVPQAEMVQAQPGRAANGTGLAMKKPAPMMVSEAEEIAADIITPGYQDEGRDQFEDLTPNPVKQVASEPVSTFSVDVDTASYAFVRKSLNNGRLPQKDAVRVEEMINYFDYDYPLPESAEQPFKPSVAVYPTPWNLDTKLVHIGIKGHDIVPAEKPKSNLVFLLDVSGSMNAQDKLPLLKNAFQLLVENLQPEDTVSIVTYAGHAGTVLEPTKVAEKSTILSALDRLQSGGSTAGAQGIKQAYALAEQQFDKDGVNRVILATDGDFNVGITNREELKGFIERKRESGIFLSVLGFGQGNYNDALMQALAQNGNGNAAYIDTLNEARKVLVDEASSTLFPIAKDVKIQIEFNPQTVSEYRLIGYETRMLNREDFNNDAVDAGDIGSGHTVTAIYEITPVGSKAQLIDDLRYQKQAESEVEAADMGAEYAFLKLRYKLPDEDKSRLISLPIDAEQEAASIDQTIDDIRFAASVAAFGQLLRGESYMGDFTYDDVLALAKGATGDDAFGYRHEFLNLVRLAKSARDM